MQLPINSANSGGRINWSHNIIMLEKGKDENQRVLLCQVPDKKIIKLFVSKVACFILLS